MLSRFWLVSSQHLWRAGGSVHKLDENGDAKDAIMKSRAILGNDRLYV
jgi:hypothetical protein